MGNARLDLREGQGPIILVGPRGPTRLARPRAAGPASRGLRGLAVFWSIVLLGAALGAVTLQALGPPKPPVAPPASAVPAAAVAPGPTLAARDPEAPSSRLAAGAFVAIPTPEILPIPPLPAAAPRPPAPNAPQSAPVASTVLPGQPNAPVRRAVIHYRAGAPTDDVDRLADRARAIAGRVELRAVPATPSRPGIRYFFNEDAAAAEALAAALASAGGGAFQVRGFPDYRPSPQPGTIEVWLP